MVARPSILKCSGSEPNSFQRLPRCTRVPGRCFPPRAGSDHAGTRRRRPGRWLPAAPPRRGPRIFPRQASPGVFLLLGFIFFFIIFFLRQLHWNMTDMVFSPCLIAFCACAGFFVLCCFLLFFFCGCPKKVCILSRFLNPFSTREITGKDVESFLLVLCVKGGLVNPELFFL